MKGRAAKLYDAVPILYVNGLYPVVFRMADEPTDEFCSADDPEEARALALQASRRALAFRVGKATGLRWLNGYR